MKILSALSQLPDHRGRQGRDYSLSAILGTVILGKLCGRRSLASICRFAKLLTPEQQIQLGYKKGKTPCHSTFTETFRGINIEKLEYIISQEIVLSGQKIPANLPVAIDGKRLRGSRHDEQDGVHLLSMFCQKFHGVLKQAQLKKGENEISSAMRTLQGIDLSGQIITGDAIFTQEKICQKIIDKKGNYVFNVKNNQKVLKRNIEQAFEDKRFFSLQKKIFRDSK